MMAEDRGDALPVPAPHRAAISVVVVTRDRPAPLSRCLAALARQTVALQVVVVDDGSADCTSVPAIVARAGDGGGELDARVMAAGGRGPAGARNAGARAAAGAIICFTDDDCAPRPRWAQELAAACSADGAAAGTTLADPAAGRAATASQLITHALQMASLLPTGPGAERAAPRLGFAPACNLACRADIARALPFDEAFPLAAGEDRDWCARLQAAGVELRFVPEAVVEHHPCMGPLGLVRQQLRYGRGAVRYRGAAGGRRLSGRAFYLRLARDAVRAGPAVAALVLAAQVAVAAGAAVEATRRR